MGDDWESLFSTPFGNLHKTESSLSSDSGRLCKMKVPVMRPQNRKSTHVLDLDNFKINHSSTVGATRKKVPWAGGDYFGYCYMSQHLSKEEGCQSFHALLEAHWAQESLSFWKKVEQLHSADVVEVPDLALAIYNEYFRQGCPSPLNVSSQVLEAVRKTPPSALKSTTFDDVQIEISKSMQLNFWSQYVHSAYHVKYLEARFKKWKVRVPRDKKRRRKMATYDSDRPDYEEGIKVESSDDASDSASETNQSFLSFQVSTTVESSLSVGGTSSSPRSSGKRRSSRKKDSNRKVEMK